MKNGDGEKENTQQQNNINERLALSNFHSKMARSASIFWGSWIEPKRWKDSSRNFMNMKNKKNNGTNANDNGKQEKLWTRMHSNQ